MFMGILWTRSDPELGPKGKPTGNYLVNAAEGIQERPPPKLASAVDYPDQALGDGLG
jgi:hypothetical protein